MFELCEDLKKRGHRISVITTFPKYNLEEIPHVYRKKLFLKENYKGITVYRVPPPPIHNAPHVIRALSQWILASMFLFIGLFPKKNQIILVYSPPLTLGLSAYIISKINKIPYVFNIQDLFPKFAIELGALKNKAIINFYRKVEYFICKKADLITVHSEGNKEYIQNIGIPENKIRIIHNWVDLEYMKPLDKFNWYRKYLGLNNKFIVSFAGVIGLAQDLISVIRSASLLKDNEDISFLIAGDGLDKKEVVKEAEQLNLKNVIFLPFQKREKYPELIAASDVGLVTLKKMMKTPVVPGKLQNIMAGERPVLLSVPAESDANKIVNEAKCGICVEPENPKEMADAILYLYNNRTLAEKMGKNGRSYVENNFSLEISLKKYEDLLMNTYKNHSLES